MAGYAGRLGKMDDQKTKKGMSRAGLILDTDLFLHRSPTRAFFSFGVMSGFPIDR